jgi:hypothetical protein
MDFGKLIEQAGRIIWRHKFLLALGFVLAMINESTNGFVEDLANHQLRRRFPEFSTGFGAAPTDGEFAARMLRQILLFAGGNGTVGWIITGTLSFTLLIVVGLILVLANAALIAGAGKARTATRVSAGSALRTAWRRLWRLLVIDSIPYIPITIAAIVAVGIAAVMVQQAGGSDFFNRPAELRQQIGLRILAISSLIALPFVLITITLEILRGFAERACILDDSGIAESYRRAWMVLRRNIGSALLLLLLQWGIAIIAGGVLALPAFAASYFFVLTPLLWVLSGAVQAYIITLWTLAWKAWTQPTAVDLPAAFSD